MGVLNDLLDRLKYIEEEAVPDTVAFASIFPKPPTKIAYWTNQVVLTPPQSVLGATARLVGVTVTARLHRAPFSQTQTDTTLEYECIEDLDRVVRRFTKLRDLESAAFSAAFPSLPRIHPNLSPQSALYGGGRLDVYGEAGPDGAAMIGTTHTVTFAYLIP